MQNVGIDAIQYYVPQIYLPIASLAEARGIEYAKLNKGLGLEAMSLCDVNEDVATMAAEAALKLIAEQNIDLRDLDRIYLGTESALDSAKPTAAYILGIIEQRLAAQYGERSLQNCDVIDLTFACIGGVDALLNSADYIRLNPKRKALVIAADKAQYDLASTGEYTQGAGAVALLITANPRILSLEQNFGVATKSEFDFFKPRRKYSKVELLQKAAKLLGQELKEEDLEALYPTSDHPFWADGGKEIELFKEEPVFDGPYSNDCYKARTSEALDHLQKQEGHLDILKDWSHMVFHLPYAFQGRRMFVEMWLDRLSSVDLEAIANEMGVSMQKEDQWTKDQIKAGAKCTLYRSFVKDTLEAGERASSLIGNMYTASIFMSFLSLLAVKLDEGAELSGKGIGFVAYGSGSKSKVFHGTIEADWKAGLPQENVFEALAERKAISFEDYEALHKGNLQNKLGRSEGARLDYISSQVNQEGYRFYKQD